MNREAVNPPSGTHGVSAQRPGRLTMCVYCGSRAGADPAYAHAARDLGAQLGRRGLDLIYGGGRVGLMGLLADAALAHGAQVTGVIPQRLLAREVGHRGLHELQVVADMHERKRRMAEAADAFVVLPGGVGTMEEFFEVWTWRQLGYHDQPIGLLNVAGYFDPLQSLVEHMVKMGFLDRSATRSLSVETDPGALLDRMVAAAAVAGAPDDYSGI